MDGLTRCRWSAWLLVWLLLTVFILPGALPLHAGGIRATWNASDRATGYKLYAGTASGVYPEVTDVGNLTTVQLSGFTEGTRYYFAVTAYNTFGESGYSAEVSKVIETPPPDDTTPPTVLITNPPDGSTVLRKSLVSIVAAATDNVAIARVEFYLNGQQQATDTTDPYTWGWKVPATPNRTYTLEALAFDTAGLSQPSPPVTVRSN